MPLCELATSRRIVGGRQVRRAIEDNVLVKIFVARDADPRLVAPLIEEAGRKSIPVEWVETMVLLGRASAIGRGASVAGIRVRSEEPRDIKD